MNTTKETDPTHKRVIVEKFSEDTEYWQKVYQETPDTEKTFLTSELVERKKAVLAFIDRYAGDRKLSILDIGCGTGVTMIDLLRRGHSVSGLDITEAMLRQAKATVGEFMPDRARCIAGDVENVPFEDDSFDVVLCVGVLQYLQSDQKGISEMRRVVRDGGLVIITLPNMFKISNLLDPYYYLIRGIQFISQKSRLWEKKETETLSPVDFDSNKRFANRRYYYGQLSDLFERNNLRQVDIAGIAFGPLTFWRKQILPDALSIRISRFMRNMTCKKYFSFVNPVATRWVICLRKSCRSSDCW